MFFKTLITLFSSARFDCSKRFKSRTLPIHPQSRSFLHLFPLSFTPSVLTAHLPNRMDHVLVYAVVLVCEKSSSDVKSSSPSRTQRALRTHGNRLGETIEIKMPHNQAKNHKNKYPPSFFLSVWSGRSRREKVGYNLVSPVSFWGAYTDRVPKRKK